MVSLYTKSNYIFLQTVMNKFIKPFIDALISEPDEDPLSQYRVKLQDKTVGKEYVTTKPDNQIQQEKCQECGTVWQSKRELRIHVAKMHRDNNLFEEKKRKFGEEKDLTHNVVSNKSHIAEVSAPIEEAEVKKVSKEVTKQCSDCDMEIKAENGKDLILETINHNSVCTMKPAINKAPVHIELAPSPPRKKIKEIVVGETEVYIQEDIENILHSMKKIEVDEENEEISEYEKVPDRLKSMLKI